MELADFLLARIAEDEAVALRITPGRNAANGHWRADSLEFTGIHDRETTRHIVRWDPARVLAECEAKRRIVEHCQDGLTEASSMPYGGASGLAEDTLKLLALPYADHPDYRQEWRP